MKYGLVLEGGAMRGLFTAGILDVFLEEDITFDGCIGTSAGAVFGCNFKSKQHGRTLRYNLKYCKDPRYISWRNLLFTGDLYGVKFCYEEIPNCLDPFDTKTYLDNPMVFYACCTDLESGKAVYPRCDKGDQNDILWMRASASMPMFSRIVEIDGGKYLDGGIADSVPLRQMEAFGYEKNVVILTQPKTYRKTRSVLSPVIEASLSRFPEAKKAMRNRHHDYNDTIAYIRKQTRAKQTLVLQPPAPLPITRTEKDPDKLKKAYDIGRQVAKKQLSQVKEFLQ